MKTRTRVILWLGLIVYALGLFAALTFYRLPADRILSKAVERMSDERIRISVGNMSSSIWKGHRLENLTWTIQSEDFVVVEPMAHLTLSPAYLKLLQGYIPLCLKGALAGGSVEISMGISMLRGLNKGYANIKAEGIRLENLEALRLLAQREIKGKVTGRASLSGSLHDPSKISGQGTFTVQDGALDMKTEVFGIKTLPFAKATLPFSIRDGAAEINQGEIAGPLFEGNFEGRIRLHPDLQASTLQVVATIRPGLSLQEGRAGSLPALGARPIVIQLQGTVAAPVISWTGAFQ